MNHHIEDILRKIWNAKKDLKDNQQIPNEMVAELVQSIKEADEMFLLTCSITKTPAVVDGCAHLFSSEWIAKKAAMEMKKKGINVNIVSTDDIFDSIYPFFYRYGIQNVYINKGNNGIGLPLSIFIVPEKDIRQDIYNQIKTAVSLNVAINNMAQAFANDFGEVKNTAARIRYESEFTRELAKSKVCFLSTDVLPEKTTLKNGDSAYFVFSDITELVTTFPLAPTVTHMKTMPMVDLLRSIKDSDSCPIILNAGTSEITIGAENILECLEYESIREQIVDFARSIYKEENIPEEQIDAIMKYRDIYMEFISGINLQNEFIYPETHKAIVVGNFTADILQRMSAKNPIEAYNMLSLKRDNL